jgi:hypothetical protein
VLSGLCVDRRVFVEEAMSRVIKRSSLVLLALFLLPSLAYAQAAITGVVKDTSGAVLPGVTVEAASPVLIEKVRSSGPTCRSISEITLNAELAAFAENSFSLRAQRSLR